MAVKPILRMGEPLLWQQAAPVTHFNTPELHALIQDLEDTMHAMNGAGIAAPQIGISLQVVIFGQRPANAQANPRYAEAHLVPYTVLINPTITLLGDTQEEGWEGCLSVPGMRGLVPRHQTIEYTGFDALGNPIQRHASGFHARVVQHECDHLQGVLYPMRIPNLQKFGFTDVIFPNQDIQED